MTALVVVLGLLLAVSAASGGLGWLFLFGAGAAMFEVSLLAFRAQARPDREPFWWER